MTIAILPVTSADIDAAARVIAPYAVRTPLLSPPVLNERMGTRIFLKPEMLQRTGSFKFRGAFNKLSSIPQEARGGIDVGGSHRQDGDCHRVKLRLRRQAGKVLRAGSADETRLVHLEWNRIAFRIDADMGDIIDKGAG